MKTESLLPAPWRDISSFSRSDIDRTPKSWEWKSGKLRIVVTRHIGYGPEQWLIVCHDPEIQQVLASKEIREAACQAKAIVQVQLEELLAALTPPNP